METTDMPAEPGTPIRAAPPSAPSTPARMPATPPPADEVPPSPARPFWRGPYLQLVLATAAVLYWCAALRRP